MKNIRRWKWTAIRDVLDQLTEEEARLMASAPDLLEALIFAEKELKRLDIFFKKTQDNGVSALALGLAENALNIASGQE